MNRIALALILVVLIAGLVVALIVAQTPTPRPGVAPVVDGSSIAITPPIQETRPTTVARAASAGRLDVVRERIDAGDDLDALDEAFSMSALHHAANLGQADIAEALLEAGADPNVEDPSAKTPLHYAARNGHANVAIVLLEHGAFVDAIESKFGWTPLHLAAIENQLDVVRALLDHGADYTIADTDEIRPLHYAQSNESQEMIDLIVEHHVLQNPRQ